MDWGTIERIEELQVGTMGEKTMKEYVLTDEEVKESIEFIEQTKPQQVPQSSISDPWGEGSWMTVESDDKVIILL